MSDLVKRLRDRAEPMRNGLGEDLREAADQLERYQRFVERVRQAWSSFPEEDLCDIRAALAELDDPKP